jgi:hypothetical protein
MWMDPHTSGISPGVETEVEHVSWYIEGGRRYGIDEWPEKLPFFDKSEALYELTEYPASLPVPTRAEPCAPGTCPATGATTPSVGTTTSSFTVDASLGSRASS